VRWLDFAQDFADAVERQPRSAANTHAVRAAHFAEARPRQPLAQKQPIPRPCEPRAPSRECRLSGGSITRPPFTPGSAASINSGDPEMKRPAVPGSEPPCLIATLSAHPREILT
jgi:hypothetical protein